jgi:hypothetical protein
MKVFHGKPSITKQFGSVLIYTHASFSHMDKYERPTSNSLEIGDRIIIDSYETAIVSKLYNVDEDYYIYFTENVYTGIRDEKYAEQNSYRKYPIFEK